MTSLATYLIQQKIVERWWGPNLLEPGPIGPELPFEDWAHAFAAELKSQAEGKEIVAVGYSMGGRLLLHVLKFYPQLFKKVVIVSSQVELSSKEEMQKRKLWELNWAVAFHTKEWRELWSDWNHMEVLKSSVVRPTPKEKVYSRKFLALALKNWSVLQHLISYENFRHHPCPLLWLAGEKDSKYVQLYREKNESGDHGKVMVISDAGHRVHLDRPEHFAQVVTSFFSR